MAHFERISYLAKGYQYPIFTDFLTIFNLFQPFVNDLLSQKSLLQQSVQKQIRLTQNFLSQNFLPPELHPATQPLPQSPLHQRRHAIHLRPSPSLRPLLRPKKLQRLHLQPPQKRHRPLIQHPHSQKHLQVHHDPHTFRKSTHLLKYCQTPPTFHGQ